MNKICILCKICQIRGSSLYVMYVLSEEFQNVGQLSDNVFASFCQVEAMRKLLGDAKRCDVPGETIQYKDRSPSLFAVEPRADLS